MLAVGVDAPDVRVAVLLGVRIAGSDALLETPVLAEGEDSSASTRAIAAVPSVEPSSTTRTSLSGNSARSSSSTAGRFASSFQAGMKTRVSRATRRE